MANLVERTLYRLGERLPGWVSTPSEDGYAAATLPGGCPNLLAGDEDLDRVARSYGRNVEWLIRAKRRYDPDNVFRSAIPLAVASAMAGAS
jgi:hypothetical protein